MFVLNDGIMDFYKRKIQIVSKNEMLTANTFALMSRDKACLVYHRGMPCLPQRYDGLLNTVNSKPKKPL